MKSKISSKIAILCLATASIFISKNVNAQQASWFEPGTTWTYNFQDLSGAYFQTHFVIQPDVLQNQECVKMETVGDYPLQCSPFQKPFYFYQSNDSIFYASEIDSVFRLAYNFNATVGESWEYVVPSSIEGLADTFNVEVLTVNTVNIEGNDVKELLLNYQNISVNHYLEIFPQEMAVMEFIGSSGSLFIPTGQVAFCDSETAVKLQCYSSQTMDYTNPDFGSCTLSLNENAGIEPLSVYPNPTQRMVYFSEYSDFRLMDLSGRILAEGRSDAFDMSRYAFGVYVLEINDLTYRIVRH